MFHMVKHRRRPRAGPDDGSGSVPRSPKLALPARRIMNVARVSVIDCARLWKALEPGRGRAPHRTPTCRNPGRRCCRLFPADWCGRGGDSGSVEDDPGRVGRSENSRTSRPHESQNINFAIAAEDFLAVHSGQEEPNSICPIEEPARAPSQANPTWPRDTERQVVRVQHGENFFTFLLRASVSGAEAQLATISLAGVYDVRRMRAGQLVNLYFGPSRGERQFLGAAFDSTFDRTVLIQRQPDGSFQATEIKKVLARQLLRINATVDYSIFQAGLQAGLPPEPVVRFIYLFAGEVDIQREKVVGFELLIEQYRDSYGDLVRHGNILFASLTTETHVIRLYRWVQHNGLVEYFNARGESGRGESGRKRLQDFELWRFQQRASVVDRCFTELGRNGAIGSGAKLRD